MRHHLPASIGDTLRTQIQIQIQTNTRSSTNTNTTPPSTYAFSGAGGPITNFGHQLLLPTQFSFGPGTPGQFNLNYLGINFELSWKHMNFEYKKYLILVVLPGLPVLEGSSVAVSGAGDPGYGLQLAQVWLLPINVQKSKS